MTRTRVKTSFRIEMDSMGGGEKKKDRRNDVMSDRRFKVKAWMSSPSETYEIHHV